MLFSAVQVQATALPGCKYEGLNRRGECRNPEVLTPVTAEYCAGDIPAGFYEDPQTEGCCCTKEANLIINSQYDNEGNKIGTVSNEPKKPRKVILPTLSVSIPEFPKFSTIKCDEGNSDCSIPWIAEYVGAIFKYSILAIAILAVIVMMMGGVMWLTAAGNAQRVSEAKTWVINSLGGLILSLGSFLLLNTINPELTILKSINVKYIKLIDVPEIIIDPIEAEKNMKSGQQIPLGKYCGCIEWKNTKSTSTLTSAAAIDEAVKKLHPSGPLNGLGNVILAASNETGIDPAFFLGNAKVDSDMGTSGAGKTNINPGNITCYNNKPLEACKQYSSGCNGNWNTSASWSDAVKYYFCFMKNASTMSKAKTIRQLISTYAPPCMVKEKSGEYVCGNNTAHYIDYVTSTIAMYNSAATINDSSEGKSCDCFNPCDRCAQAGETCCAPKK